MSGLLEALGSARVFDLEQLRYAGAPSHPAHVPGFNYFLHRHHARGAEEARTSASGLVVMPEHSGTHIDALAHQAENLTLHGGVHVDDGIQTSGGFRVLGIDTMAPLVTRGVLLEPFDAPEILADRLRDAGERWGQSFGGAHVPQE